MWPRGDGQPFSPWTAALASCKQHVDLKVRWKKRQNIPFCLLPLREYCSISWQDFRSYCQLKLISWELLIVWDSPQFLCMFSNVPHTTISGRCLNHSSPVNLWSPCFLFHYLPSSRVALEHSLVVVLCARCKITWLFPLICCISK